MQENISPELINFIVKETFVKNVELLPNTAIEKELGVTGDDALELIIAFGEKFNVDVSKFMAADYFQPEGMNFLLPTLVPGLKILRLKHLESAIKAGRLDEEVINATV